MQFFNRDEKYNWIDENNVFIGYDNHQSCCENATYHYANVLAGTSFKNTIKSDELPGLSLESYRIDTKFFEEMTDTEDLESGDAVAFRFVSPNGPAIYLILSNSHNGYYSHGFEMNVGGQIIQSGSL